MYVDESDRTVFSFNGFSRGSTYAVGRRRMIYQITTWDYVCLVVAFHVTVAGAQPKTSAGWLRLWQRRTGTVRCAGWSCGCRPRS